MDRIPKPRTTKHRDDYFANCDGLTGEYVRSVINYYPETGILVWRPGVPGVKPDSVLGPTPKVRGKTRNPIGLAHLWMADYLPIKEVSLVDLDSMNLRWENIRRCPFGVREPRKVYADKVS